MKIGFTGTHMGMTDAQKKKLVSLIPWRLTSKKYEFHHGDCIGSDAQAHEIFGKHLTASNLVIFIHPPGIQKNRAFCGTVNGITPVILPTRDYLKRNREIVDACELLIATPFTQEEVIRSGTWYTIRYARKQRKTLIVINPDGTCFQIY